MANKTIHQLTPASTITSDTQFAIYDTVSDSTKKATASQILGTEDILYADDPSTPSGTVDFTTQDTSLNPASSVSVDLLTGSDSWSQRFVKISQMFKNVRYLLGKLGSTDISSIGDGSVTGAVSTLNSNLTRFRVQVFQNISIASSVRENKNFQFSFTQDNFKGAFLIKTMNSAWVFGSVVQWGYIDSQHTIMGVNCGFYNSSSQSVTGDVYMGILY